MIASFVFDLDSTVLQGELLPAIGEQALGDRELRGRTMESVMGAAPFAQSFPARVARLRPVPVAQAAEIARPREIWTSGVPPWFGSWGWRGIAFPLLPGWSGGM